MMGRDSHDPTSFHSSIALLQERFRQLQRVKEMREERELQKMLNEPKQFSSNTNTSISSSTYHNSNNSILSHPELIMPSRSPPHVSLSLWPTSQGKQEDYRSAQTPVSMNYAHSRSMQVSWKNANDCDSGADSGVDTSLHL
ncbi:hypothetical protein AAZX31_09G011800 [Glycine max]|nr:hypothetical protein JHK87_023647 [Glycine soja]KAG5005715.1 hypothetical protein JHK85_024257 [Glycine max]KAG5011502.1 hypothetical protein JHK86_023763 [Glycine max]KAH1040956.1 hypothetical protein GYH30_023690 [Glycine max]KAH1231579.1 hypothetical protein GmHk_09G024448 [Glycine max]